MKEIKKQWRSFTKELSIYWKAYGGTQKLIRSPYLLLSVPITIVIHAASSENWLWYTTALSVIPNIIGFTLGGYSIMLAVGDSRFRNDISRNGGCTHSPFITISASIAHFILLQIITLLLAIIYCSIGITGGFLNFLGLAVFIYSILLCVSATLTIFFLSRMFNMHLALRKSKTIKRRKIIVRYDIR